MRHASKLNLDELPDSPYAACLQDAAERALRFPPELEREFRAFQLAGALGLVRIWQLLVLGLLLADSVTRMIAGDAPPGGPSSGVVWFLLLPLSVSLCALSWSERYTAWYRPWSRVLVPILVGVLATDAADMLAHGRTIGVASLAVTVAAGYLLIGALFIEGLVLTAVALAALLVGYFLVHGPVPGFWGWYLLVTSVATVGALASYNVEKTSRKHFLESGLLGEMAWRDGLTGLKNRRAFDEHLASVWQQGARDKHTVGLLLVDIDHFKAYNDACGHQQGDECLRRVGAVLEGFARRPLDMVARYGGEELVVVLYQSGSDRTQEVAEDLRRSIERLRIEHPQSPSSAFVTVSVGAACVRASADRSPEGLIQLADEALYAAKHDTRNCVRFQQAEYATLSTGNFRRPWVRLRGEDCEPVDRAAGG